MKIAVGTDEKTHLTDIVVEDMKRRGYEVDFYGPTAWPDVAEQVAKQVAGGEAEQGIIFCWTGTGVAIVANKVPGIRAALCWDAEIARGARKWDDANVLCMSLRATSEVVAKEILDAWFSTTEIDPSEKENIEKVKRMDEARSQK